MTDTDTGSELRIIRPAPGLVLAGVPFNVTCEYQLRPGTPEYDAQRAAVFVLDDAGAWIAAHEATPWIPTNVGWSSPNMEPIAIGQELTLAVFPIDNAGAPIQVDQDAVTVTGAPKLPTAEELADSLNAPPATAAGSPASAPAIAPGTGNPAAILGHLDQLARATAELEGAIAHAAIIAGQAKAIVIQAVTDIHQGEGPG